MAPSSNENNGSTLKTLSLTFRNILRNKRRTVLTLLSIIIGVVSLVLFDGFVNYTLWGLRESTIKNGVGHLQISTDDGYFLNGSFDPFSYLLPNLEDLEKKIKKNPDVKDVVPSITFSGTLAGGEKSGIVMIQATDPERSTSLLGFRSIVDGRDLNGEDTAKVVLAKGVAKKLCAKVGDILTLMSVTKGGGTNAIDVEVVGIASVGLRELDNITVYLPLRTAQQFLMITTVPLLILVLEKTEYTDETFSYIQQKIVPTLSTRISIKKWKDIADYYVQVDGFYKQILSIIRLIIVLVVIFTIVNTMTMSVFERTREIGTLRALGTTKAKIMISFILEGMWIGLIGGIFGVAAGFGISALINSLFGGIYIPPPPGMAEGYQALFKPDLSSGWCNILLSFSVAAIASIYPATKAIKLKIADALRYN